MSTNANGPKRSSKAHPPQPTGYARLCEGREVVIVQGAVSPGHVHMLVSVPPQLAPAKLAQHMKNGRWSRLLPDEFPQLQGYWGQHLWAREYFCASVGAVDEETIRKYIESQQWEYPEENFKITAPGKP